MPVRARSGTTSSLEQELEDLTIEREKVVTWARKNIITEGDLQVQLATLDSQKAELTREWNEKRLLLGNRAERLIYLAGVYRDRARLGYDAIQTNPSTPEAAEAIFQARRKIIDGLLVKADVLPDKSIKVYLELDLEEQTEDECLRIRYSPLHY